jgi:hypothetical protein
MTSAQADSSSRSAAGLEERVRPRDRVLAIAGASGGLLVWLGCYLQPAAVPDAILFYVAAAALIIGCGAWPVSLLCPDASRLERVGLSLALGLAIAPALICVFALLEIAVVFPPIAFAATGVAVARAIAGGLFRAPRRALWLGLIPLALAIMTGWVSAGRMTMTEDRIALYGNYDTLDLTYYAAISTQLNQTNRLPPRSPFYAGHRIIYSYFPLAFLGAVHTLTGVSTLKAFLWFGWPFFTFVSSAMLLALCRRLGGAVFAMVATVMVFTAASLAYLVAWLAPEMVAADTLIWSSVFLAPSAEWLPFNPWAPTLGVVAAGLYAVDRLREPRWPLWTAWALVAGMCFGFTFMFKSFAFLTLAPALAIVTAVWMIRRDGIWLRFAVTGAAAALSAAPWAAAVLPYNRLENRGALIAVEYLTLVRRMLFKTGITDSLQTFVGHFVASDPHFRILLALAIVIFLIGGLGARLAGLPAVVPAALGRRGPAWTLLGWIVLLGVTIPFFISIAPFPNSIQTYQFALFALSLFTARVLWPPNAGPTALRVGATAIVLALSVPSTLHYARAAHNATADPPLLELGAADQRIIRYLRRTDPRTTMMLHSNTLYPSVYSVESERRIVLGWSSYVSGDENPEVDALSERIARFFGSPSSTGSDDADLLKRYAVTHVIERVASDQLNPNVVQQLRLVTGSPAVRLYEVPSNVAR